ncbi:MAG: glycosyltransferase family 4 protein [Lachnospiraceae bacterium]|nr:glycosyltransferase family 4 protein [Lachnospiraceae bacterium]
MNIIFLTIGNIADINQSGTYTDLLRHFQRKGHKVYVVCQRERRLNLETELQEGINLSILRVKTGNITKVNFIEKGISTLLIGYRYQKAIQKYLSHISFDLVLYSTPPITLASVVKWIKSKYNAVSYLMLKDIFPQNAVDLGILKKQGLKGPIYRYFRKKEKQLYAYSDKIGCMSKANLEYIKQKNPEVLEEKLEICPNTIDNIKIEPVDRKEIRKKYNIPEDKIVFIYGGNFGKPQDIDYILKVLKESRRYLLFHFIMCGSGTEFYRIQACKKEGIDNLTVIAALPYEEYVELLKACDIGMIFLDSRFTIPNFPSRLLDYLNYGLPVIAATDKNTDLGEIIIKNEFGWWCESNYVENYMELLEQIEDEIEIISEKGMCGKKYMLEHFTTGQAYRVILNSYNKAGR